MGAGMAIAMVAMAAASAYSASQSSSEGVGGGQEPLGWKEIMAALDRYDMSIGEISATGARSLSDVNASLNETLNNAQSILDEGTNFAIFGTADKEEIMRIMEESPGGLRRARDLGLKIAKEYEIKAVTAINEASNNAINFIKEAEGKSEAAIKDAETRAGRALDESERNAIRAETEGALKAERKLDESETKAIDILRKAQETTREDITTREASAILAQDEGYARSKKILTPYLEAGKEGLAMLLGASDFEVTSLAGYKRELEKGTEEINRAFASRGLRNSGANLEQLEDFKRGLYDKYQQKEEARRERVGGALAGYGYGAAGQQAGLAGTMAGTKADIYGTAASGLAGAGQAYGAGEANVAYGTGAGQANIATGAGQRLAGIYTGTGAQRAENIRGAGQGLRNVYMPAGAAAAGAEQIRGQSLSATYRGSGQSQAGTVMGSATTEAGLSQQWGIAGSNIAANIGTQRAGLTTNIQQNTTAQIAASRSAQAQASLRMGVGGYAATGAPYGDMAMSLGNLGMNVASGYETGALGGTTPTTTTTTTSDYAPANPGSYYGTSGGGVDTGSAKTGTGGKLASGRGYGISDYNRYELDTFI